jgi:hypothetical protein
MRTNTVKAARKAQGGCARAGCTKQIQKGDSYYWVKGRFGPKRVFCAAHRPRASEKTSSDKLSQLYAAQETAEDDLANAAGYGDVAEMLRNAAMEAEEVASGYNESADNVDEHFPGSPQVDEIREKAEACETWQQALEDAAEEIDGLDPEDYEDEDTRDDDRLDDANDLATSALSELEL